MTVADCFACCCSAPLRSFSAAQYSSSFPLIDRGCLQPSNFICFAENDRVLFRVAICSDGSWKLPRYQGYSLYPDTQIFEDHCALYTSCSGDQVRSEHNLSLPEAAIASISRVWVSTVTCMQPSNRDGACQSSHQ